MKFLKISAPRVDSGLPTRYFAVGIDRAGEQVFKVHGPSMEQAKKNLLFMAKALHAAGTEVEFIPSFSWTQEDFTEVLG